MKIISEETKMNHNLIIKISVFLLFIVAFTVAAASAGSVTADVPTVPVEINSTTTVPVMIHDAANIVGFKILVYNNVSGAKITINTSRPLDDGNVGGDYTVNSNSENDCQIIVWFTGNAEGICGNAELFSIDILSTDKAPSVIPLRIEVADDLYDTNYNEVHTSYPVTNVELTVNGGLETNTAVQSAGSKNVSNSTPTLTSTITVAQTTVVPTTEVAQNNVIQSQVPTQDAEVYATPALTETHTQTKTKQTASPMPFIGLIAALGFTAGMIILRRNKQ